jgi:hypothetical protein
VGQEIIFPHFIERPMTFLVPRERVFFRSSMEKHELIGKHCYRVINFLALVAKKCKEGSGNGHNYPLARSETEEVNGMNEKSVSARDSKKREYVAGLKNETAIFHWVLLEDSTSYV